METFSAAEASRLAGFIKPWMLNHLEREGTFIPDKTRERQHGRQRSYTYRDIVILRAINRLLKLGARPKRIKDSIDTFARVCPSFEDGDQLLAFSKRASFFVVTDKHVLYCKDEGELIDLAKSGQLAFSFMVDGNQQISPSISAALFYVEQIQKGRKRGEGLLSKTAKRFNI